MVAVGAAVVLIVWATDDRGTEHLRAARSQMLPDDTPPQPDPPEQTEPESVSTPEKATEPDPAPAQPSLAVRLERRAATLDAALANDARLGDVPRSLAELLAEAAAAERGAALQALSRLVLTDSFESPLTSGFAAFVYGALAHDAGPLPLAKVASDSWRFRLLLLGTRVTIDGAVNPERWEPAMRGAILHAFKRWDRKHRMFDALHERGRTSYPNGAEYKAWDRVQKGRVLPPYAIDALRARIPDREGFDPRTRRWTVRAVMRAGLRDPIERGLAYEWLQKEQDAETRAELLSGPMRSGDASAIEAVWPRLESMVAGGQKDAPNALRHMFSMDRERTRKHCSLRYSEWTPAVRKVAVRDVLVRFGEQALPDFRRHWELERDRGVNILILQELDRQKLNRTDRHRDKLLHIGDRHHELLVELRTSRRTATMAKRWLAYIGRAR